jgi:hypothetical protein
METQHRVVNGIRIAGHKSRMSTTVQHFIEVVPLEALASSQEAAVVKHVLTGRIEGPVVALSGIAGFTRNLHEAIVQREVMTY